MLKRNIFFSEKDVTNIDVIKFVIETELLVTVEKMGSAVPVILCVVDFVRKSKSTALRGVWVCVLGIVFCML